MFFQINFIKTFGVFNAHQNWGNFPMIYINLKFESILFLGKIYILKLDKNLEKKYLNNRWPKLVFVISFFQHYHFWVKRHHAMTVLIGDPRATIVARRHRRKALFSPPRTLLSPPPLTHTHSLSHSHLL
jgi:hypothetical protein